MHNTDFAYYHDEAFLTRLFKRLVKSFNYIFGRPFAASGDDRRDYNELESGAYNEAFIVQTWTSYSPRN